ncbi:MAG: DoxX family protein [Vicinamibacterales bacterium]|nr:DoxX family protein [Vicinamibacterales bacterium]
MTLIALLAACTGAAFVIYGISCLSSERMRAEFRRFGLERFRVLTGALEVLGGTGLVGGLLWPPALWLSSGGLALLMLLGVAVRVRVGDGLRQTLPALLLMLVNVYILSASWPSRG